MDDPVRVISTTQVGITAIAILTGAVGEPVVRDLLGDGIPTWLSFVIAFAVVTYLSVVVGELVPKALTLQRAETLAALIAPAIELLERVLKPIVWVLERSAALLLRPFGIREVTAGAGIRSAEELRALVDEAEGSGVIGRAQEQLLHNVFDFGTREARDVMVPALDVEWIDGRADPARRPRRGLERPHSRYPVGAGSLDHLVGDGPHARPRRGRARRAAARSASSRGRRSSCPRPRTSARCCASCARRAGTWRSWSTSTARPRAS